MTEFLVVEIQIWLFALLLILGVGALVGLWFLGRAWLRRHDGEVVEAARTEVDADANVRRNRMLIRLDHELKNPLTALRTTNATMRHMVADPNTRPEELSAALDAVDGSSRRVARLLADLRRLADIETRQIEFVRVDMDRLVYQAVEDARTAPGADDRTIVATVARAPWRLPNVAGEEDMLLSAVLNLLGNALKYSRHPDVVELRANEQIIDGFRWVVIEVADTGMGIPPGEQAHVWEELSRGQEVRAVSGSGMGLALVRSIVVRHGGSVELFSQPGVGTSVRLVLPVLDDSQSPAAPEEQNHPHAPVGPQGGSRPVQPFQDDRVGYHPSQQYQPPLTGAHEQYRPRHDFRPAEPQPSGPQPSGPQQPGSGPPQGSVPQYSSGPQQPGSGPQHYAAPPSGLSGPPHYGDPASGPQSADAQAGPQVSGPQASGSQPGYPDPDRQLGTPRRTSRRRLTGENPREPDGGGT